MTHQQQQDTTLCLSSMTFLTQSRLGHDVYKLDQIKLLDAGQQVTFYEAVSQSPNKCGIRVIHAIHAIRAMFPYETEMYDKVWIMVLFLKSFPELKPSVEAYDNPKLASSNPHRNSITINKPFMQRLVSYSQSALSIYKTYSIVLIVCTNRVSPIQLMAKFKPISEKLWMSLLLPTDFWAQSCFIVSKLTLSSIASSDQLTPLQALSSFLTEASPTLYENQVECDKDVSNVVDIICYNNKKILMKADAALFGVSGSFKAKNLIECALVFNAATKRKYCQTVGSDSDSLLELLPKLKGKPREVIQDKKQDDLEFMINYQKNLIGKMN
ncbi:hypothetical protein PHYBLDRAFT_138633 [Phycomyces blakesleeanus NRRL 1555(-)]|uniref:Uncharacterized protein n=1 Tax=Phycomyces blakesleeanus (strain ATCC 8743b / DSM 1359 / FGSC 10004 / NBRC 33097 / NRRL 1555) TaxID=763407 RepID=A0A167R8C0_PHYB8|nr:hypothetical protein PHYBLDRAFT_138633 [Phycomyces blakesleeanus NRRL 1555(-)]OAD81088.1 hypothetical protein PHYBLDRAFT_138633 [Phycomyces blakesleeanus NRRL 1555(-)]|eukprot:XP_018299128.1 hypothetical protein PHYBLDRAFT_138633 [Phycomyces blakesleeanus NRRL 1555(-)]